MKTIMVLLSFLVSASAFAANYAAMTPAQIDALGGVQLDRNDKIVFNELDYGLVEVNSWSSALCTDGALIYGGTRTVKYCKDNGSCTSKTVNLIQPVNGYRQVCGSHQGGECKAMKTVSFRQSIHRAIKILKVSGGKEPSVKVVGVKNYTIPYCN